MASQVLSASSATTSGTSRPYRARWDAEEDYAKARCASVDGAPCGSFGDFTGFSFCQDKIITTGGEGDPLALDDERVTRDAWTFKDHARSYADIHERDHPPGFRYAECVNRWLPVCS